jgi:hypothetical protein
MQRRVFCPRFAAVRLRPGLIALLILWLFCGIAPAQEVPTYTDLHDFGGKVINANGKLGPDGTHPTCGVAFDRIGDMFGTTSEGGAYGQGILWEITIFGTYKDLHDFGGTILNANFKTGPDGTDPGAAVYVDPGGNVYGIASYGGPNLPKEGGAGMLWELEVSGMYRDLHDFGGTIVNADGAKGPDGTHPVATVIEGNEALMGTAFGGGPYGGGMIWFLSNSWVYQDLHDFGGAVGADHTTDGFGADSNIVFDIAGNAYGTTEFGGVNEGGEGGGGMMWRLTPSGVYSVYCNFGGLTTNSQGRPCSYGKWPVGPIIMLLSPGASFGTCTAGGPDAVFGSQGSGTFWMGGSDVYDFGGTVTNTDGKKGPDGNVPTGIGSLCYGTTNYGGPNESQNGGAGIVWQWGQPEDLHDFGATVVNANGKKGPDGSFPSGSVTQDRNFNLFGTTQYGGPNDSKLGGDGIVWKLTTGFVSLTASPTEFLGGNTFILTIGLGAYANDAVFSLSSSNSAVPVPTSVQVSGYSLEIPIQTLTVKAKTVVKITATLGSVVKTATVTLDPLTVDGLALSPNPLTGGNPCTATIHLDGLAPTGGLQVLVSTDSSALKVPASVTVPAGSFSTTFPVVSIPQTASVAATVTAKTGAVSQTANVTILPPVLTGLSVSPSPVQGGSSTVVTGKVTINAPAPSVGSIVTLTSSNPQVLSIPAGVKIVGGTTSVTFPTRHFAVTTTQFVTVTAKFGKLTESVEVEVTP